jgi:hypothetical protein
MPFVNYEGIAAPKIGQAMSLGRSHIDPATPMLTFIYYEYVQNGVWVHEERQQVLVENTHFSLDAPRGVITLLAHAFWYTLGLWRAADNQEELLYKGHVKAPQRVEFTFDYYKPADVGITTDKTQIVGDGVEQVIITVYTDEDTEAVIAVMKDGEKIGSWTIPITAGSGTKTITSTVTGTYTLTADTTVLNAQDLPKYQSNIDNPQAIVEVV